MNFLKNNKLMVFGLVFLLIALGITGGSQARQDGMLNDQVKQIEKLESRQAVLEASMKESQVEAVRTGSGIDMGRVAGDDKVVEAMARDLFTWDSHKTYVDARQMAIKQHKVDPKSSLLTDFMPEVFVAKDGSNIIDMTGLNMHYGSLDSRVLGINGQTYHYLTLVTVSSADKRGATASGKIILEYDTNSDHEVSNLVAYR